MKHQPGVMIRICFLPALLALSVLWSADSVAAAPGNPTAAPAAAARASVLILSSLQRGYPIPDATMDAAFASLRQRGVSAQFTYVEYLDIARNTDPDWRGLKLRELQAKLSGRQIAAVIVADGGALGFIHREGRSFVPPETPVITTLASDPAIDDLEQGQLINVFPGFDVVGTLRLGMALFPDTRHLLVVDGPNGVQPPVLPAVEAFLAQGPNRPTLEVVTELDYDAMLERVARLAPDTLILMGAYFRDHAGHNYVPAEVARAVAERANAPVLGIYEAHIRAGLLGGSVLLRGDIGREAGKIAFEFLSGARRFAPGMTEEHVAPHPMFDWPQLQRWRGNTASLPDGTLFLNRPSTLWDDFREAVILAAASLVLLAALVVALGWQNRRRASAERALREQQAGLEQMVKERTEQLAVRTREAQAASAATQQANHLLVDLGSEHEAFAYAVSHDLRTPLRAIDGFSTLLLRDQGGGIDAIGQDHLRRIRAAAQHMGQMYDDMHALLRIGRSALQLERFDLSAMAAELAADLQAGEPQRAVEFDIEPALSVTADPLLLRVVLGNLLGNAWKFSARVEHARIAFGCERIDGAEIFFVRDNGAGFDAAGAGKLFNAFQRLHRPWEFPGRGIGLTIAQRIVARHGGRIWAEGTIDAGATFRFTLTSALPTLPESHHE